MISPPPSTTIHPFDRFIHGRSRRPKASAGDELQFYMLLLLPSPHRVRLHPLCLSLSFGMGASGAGMGQEGVDMGRDDVSQKQHRRA